MKDAGRTDVRGEVRSRRGKLHYQGPRNPALSVGQTACCSKQSQVWCKLIRRSDHLYRSNLRHGSGGLQVSQRTGQVILDKTGQNVRRAGRRCLGRVIKNDSAQNQIRMSNATSKDALDNNKWFALVKFHTSPLFLPPVTQLISAPRFPACSTALRKHLHKF